MSDCTRDCSDCAKDCKQRTASQKSKLNQYSRVKKVYAVMSAKGGVGKSMVTAQLACLTRRLGKSVAILDGDVTGASMTRYFGIKDKAFGSDKGISPAVSATGIKIVSTNMFLQDEDAPVVWRSSLATGALLQFWTDVYWGDVDVMFIDTPPGTGDIPLTIFQSLPIDGIIIVTSPQELVGMIASKGVNMAKTMKIPVIALVENMSYYVCDKCGEVLNIFGESKAESVAKRYGIVDTARLPLSPALSASCDRGEIEYFDGDWLESLAKKL